MSNCIAYSKPGQDLFVTFTNAWYIWGVSGVGLFLLFLGHVCASVLIYFHIFSRICCILTSITLRKPCSCFSPPFPFQFSPILPPFFPSLVLGNSITALCWWNLFSVYSYEKAELLDVIVCPWNDVDAIGFTDGPECWMRVKLSGGEWWGDGSESEHIWWRLELR